jgi:hypothetical protein
MSRTYRALTTLALSLAFVAATAAVAGAAQQTPSPSPVVDQNDRLLHSIQAAQAERTQAAVEQFRAGERNLGPAPVVTFAPQPVPAATGRDVDLVAIALLALVGGLIGGAAASAGWTAANRRRHRVVAA